MLNPIHQITIEISSPGLAFAMAHELMSRYEMCMGLAKNHRTPELRARFFNEATETRRAYFACKSAAVLATNKRSALVRPIGLDVELCPFCGGCDRKEDGTIDWCDCLPF